MGLALKRGRGGRVRGRAARSGAGDPDKAEEAVQAAVADHDVCHQALMLGDRRKAVRGT